MTKLKVLVQRSDCCNSEVLLGVKREYPLGGRTWSETYRTYACENCLMECDVVDVEVCEYCGEADCECNLHSEEGYGSGQPLEHHR